MIYANAVSGASWIAPHSLWSYTNSAGALPTTTNASWTTVSSNLVTWNFDSLVAASLASWLQSGLSLYPTETFPNWPSTATRLEEAKTARHLLGEFASLKDNWDGYNASAISGEARGHARRFIDMVEAARHPLQTPEISPLPSGTISFEWETPSAHAYIEIGTTLYSGFIKTDQGPILLQGQADQLNQNVVSLIQRYISGPIPSATSTTEVHTRAPQHDLMAA